MKIFIVLFSFYFNTSCGVKSSPIPPKDSSIPSYIEQLTKIETKVSSTLDKFESPSEL